MGVKKALGVSFAPFCCQKKTNLAATTFFAVDIKSLILLAMFLPSRLSLTICQVFYVYLGRLKKKKVITWRVERGGVGQGDDINDHLPWMVDGWVGMTRKPVQL